MDEVVRLVNDKLDTFIADIKRKDELATEVFAEEKRALESRQSLLEERQQNHDIADDKRFTSIASDLIDIKESLRLMAQNRWKITFNPTLKTMPVLIGFIATIGSGIWWAAISYSKIKWTETRTSELMLRTDILENNYKTLIFKRDSVLADRGKL